MVTVFSSADIGCIYYRNELNKCQQHIPKTDHQLDHDGG